MFKEDLVIFVMVEYVRIGKKYDVVLIWIEDIIKILFKVCFCEM